MGGEIWQITWFTVLAAIGATLVMLPPGIALAWLLARKQFPGKSLLDTVASLPLVMPATATGLILLYLFGRYGPIGGLLAPLGVNVVFTRVAVVLAMASMGFPLLVRTARSGFEEVRPRYEQLAATLGAGPWRIFFTVTLPLAGRTVLAGTLLALSRGIGEFGATIVIAGNIPGRTRTLALGIFNAIEVGHDREAMLLLFVSVAIAFVLISLSNRLIHRPATEART
ncbi:MAG TPA: molybdate ABC transporter permease subunit [Vicinamibacterales bacterium]|jgi:molybdate transport system permease protein